MRSKIRVGESRAKRCCAFDGCTGDLRICDEKVVG